MSSTTPAPTYPIVTICHTETEDEIHIISMRKAELHEIETLSRYL